MNKDPEENTGLGERIAFYQHNSIYILRGLLRVLTNLRTESHLLILEL